MAYCAPCRQPHEEVTLSCRVQNARIEHNNRRHGSIAEAVALRKSGEVFECRFALSIPGTLVLENGSPRDAAMTTDSRPLRDFPRIEQLNHMGTRNVQNVRRLLGRNGIVVLNDTHVLAGDE